MSRCLVIITHHQHNAKCHYNPCHPLDENRGRGVGRERERERYENNDISYFGVIKNKIKIIIQKYKVSFD